MKKGPPYGSPLFSLAKRLDDQLKSFLNLADTVVGRILAP